MTDVADTVRSWGWQMRQVVCFVIATAMVGAGLYILWDVIFVARRVAIAIGGVGLTFALVGGLWLWFDFGAPLLRRIRGGKDRGITP